MEVGLSIVDDASPRRLLDTDIGTAVDELLPSSVAERGG